MSSEAGRPISNLPRRFPSSNAPKPPISTPRQFSRQFRFDAGKSPVKAVEQLRVEATRLMMEQEHFPMDVIAREGGFGDRKRMRRAFVHRVASHLKHFAYAWACR